MDISAISSIAEDYNGSQIDPSEYMDKISAKIIEQKDADGDGVLSVDEVKLPKEIFSIVDADGDGRISPEELKSKAAEIQNAIMGLNDMVFAMNKGPAPAQLKDLMNGIQDPSTRPEAKEQAK